MSRYNGRRSRVVDTPEERNSHLNGWRKRVQLVLDEHAGTRVDGRVASHRTRQIACDVIFAGFKTLHEELNTPLQHPNNLREEHIRKLVKYWWYELEHDAATIQTNLSIFRKFASWIGKKKMIKPLPVYLPDVTPEDLEVRAATDREKSWTTNGLDVQAKIDEAFKVNDRFGLILLVMITFGLRLKEALCLKPWKADNGKGLMIYPGDGPKGGRPRYIPYLVPEQKLVIGMVKEHVKHTHWLGWQYTRRGNFATLKSNVKEYYARMEEIGISKKLCGCTGHGLRAEFSEHMAEVKGFCPATKGGTGDQMPWDQLMSKVAEVSELLGHSRTQVMASYFGGFKRPPGTKGGKAKYVGLAGASARRLKPEQEYAAKSASHASAAEAT